MILGIYGGSSGKDLYSLILEEGKEKNWEEIIFINDARPIGSQMGIRQIPFDVFCSTYSRKDAKIIIAVGEPSDRKMLYERVMDIGYELETYIHCRASVSKFATISKGDVILNDVCISPMAKIGSNVWINGYSIVGHDVCIGNHCQISSQVIIAGHTLVGDSVFIGAGASVREEITVGDSSIISMGAVVLKTVKPETIVMGNPARTIAINEKHRIFE